MMLNLSNAKKLISKGVTVNKIIIILLLFLFQVKEIAQGNNNSYNYLYILGEKGIQGAIIDVSNGNLKEISPQLFTNQYGSSNKFRFMCLDSLNKYAFVLDSGHVYTFSINQNTGFLYQNINMTFNGLGYDYKFSELRSLVAHPAGKYLYIADRGSNRVIGLIIDKTEETLRQIEGSPFISGAWPYSIAITSDGKFLYTANYSTNNISCYKVNEENGVLTTLNQMSADKYPCYLNISPENKYLYVANEGSNNITVYSINSKTGELTSIKKGGYITGKGPNCIKFDPLGNYLYVTNFSSMNISVYKISKKNGGLIEIENSPFVSGCYPDEEMKEYEDKPKCIEIDSTGQYAYIITSASLYIYNINKENGSLTLTAGPFSIGTLPQCITRIK